MLRAVFLKETLSPVFAFLWGWAMFWSMHSGIIAASGVIFGRYLAVFIPPLDDTGIRVAAIAVILLLSFVNYLGVRLSLTMPLRSSGFSRSRST